MKVVIESDNARALDVAEILISAERAFERFLRAELSGVEAQLTVAAVKPGSIEFVLDVNEMVSGTKTAAALLAPFVNHIAQVIQTLKMGGKTNAPDRRFVKSLVQPVANDHATQINVVCNGPVIVVGQALADTLGPILNPPPTAREEGVIAKERLPSRLSPNQLRQLEQQGLQGAALNVEGQWYARLLGGSGVLVPIHDFGDAALEHNRTYTFKGRPERGRFGEIVGISISAADPLGSR